MASRRQLKDPDVFLAFIRYAEDTDTPISVSHIAKATGVPMTSARRVYDKAKLAAETEKNGSETNENSHSKDKEVAIERQPKANGKTSNANTARKRKVADPADEGDNNDKPEAKKTKPNSKSAQTGAKRGRKPKNPDQSSKDSETGPGVAIKQEEGEESTKKGQNDSSEVVV